MSKNRDDGIDVDALAVRAFNAGMYEPDCQGPDELDEETVWCGFPTCDNEAVTEVPVSNDAETATMRPACYACSEAYHTGAQYGRFRAHRQLLAYAQGLLKQGNPAEGGVIFAALRVLRSVDDPALK